MSIHPLPVFEADADPHNRDARTDEEIYAALKPPTSIVVRYGAMKMVGEFPYDGDARPGCGSKLVARTPRGTEVVEMLTSTCPNAGCSKSVTRKEMLEYIDNSGGKDYPFHTDGSILRVATIEDLNAQSALDADRREAIKVCKQYIADLGLDMKLIEAEPILGGELLTFYFMADHRVDFRQLVRQLASNFKTRIELRQVGARDEARLAADYERCGQHCCCKNFLKVLKPVSMGSAKRQKASLEPLKISGRCGRLMCCLRYEDQTYKDLRKRLPKRNSRVGTAYGPGTVVDTKLLVQLVLVKLDESEEEIAVPVEELMDPNDCPPPGSIPAEEDVDPFRGIDEDDLEERLTSRTRKGKQTQQDQYREKTQKSESSSDASDEGSKRRRRKNAGKKQQSADGGDTSTDPKKKGRKRRRRGKRGGRRHSRRNNSNNGGGESSDGNNEQG